MLSSMRLFLIDFERFALFLSRRGVEKAASSHET